MRRSVETVCPLLADCYAAFNPSHVLNTCLSELSDLINYVLCVIIYMHVLYMFLELSLVMCWPHVLLLYSLSVS